MQSLGFYSRLLGPDTISLLKFRVFYDFVYFIPPPPPPPQKKTKNKLHLTSCCVFQSWKRLSDVMESRQIQLSIFICQSLGSNLGLCLDEIFENTKH